MGIKFLAMDAERDMNPRSEAGKGVVMKIRNFFSNLWNDERGQSTTEYILMLSVAVMIAIKFKGVFGKKIEGMVEKLGGDIESNINTSN